MFITKAAIWLALWIGYGVFQNRRSNEVRAFALRIPRSRRAITGAGLFLLGTCALFGALTILTNSGGFDTVTAFFVIAAGGLLFVHVVTLATALLVTLAMENAVTERKLEASRQKEESSNQ